MNPRDRLLERALIANVVVHGLALLSMALLLLPCLPGGTASDDAVRVANIAAHPWLFRLGWFPWQLCAAADLILGVAMVRVAWLPRASAVAALLLTLIAVVPDQAAEALWITRGVDLASAGDVDAYLAFEKRIFPWSAGYGALFYTLAALAWTWCFARARTWSRTLSVLSVAVWAAMLLASLSPLLPDAVRPSARTISTVNGVGFLLLFPWLVLVTEAVLRRARPTTTWGRHAPWRHPSALRPLAFVADAVANSRFLEAVLGALPMVEMRSDIIDVVYVNYLVPSSSLQPLVPAGLELQRLGPSGEHALFTFLTYRHGNFGPSLLGPLRKMLPSPLQTNWRIHVVDPHTGLRGITFVTNAITMAPHALGARLLTAGMPMHVLHAAAIDRSADGAVVVTCDPGSGTAPDAKLALAPCASPSLSSLSAAWSECWPDYRAFLAYCVPQDRAMSTSFGVVARQEIDLGIPLDACVPLAGTVESRAARLIAGDAAPLCFYVASVKFRFSVEAHDPIPRGGPTDGLQAR